MTGVDGMTVGSTSARNAWRSIDVIGAQSRTTAWLSVQSNSARTAGAQTGQWTDRHQHLPRGSPALLAALHDGRASRGLGLGRVTKRDRTPMLTRSASSVPHRMLGSPSPSAASTPRPRTAAGLGCRSKRRDRTPQEYQDKLPSRQAGNDAFGPALSERREPVLHDGLRRGDNPAPELIAVSDNVALT